jgi:hypothetical protein
MKRVKRLSFRAEQAEFFFRFALAKHRPAQRRISLQISLESEFLR